MLLSNSHSLSNNRKGHIWEFSIFNFCSHNAPKGSGFCPCPPFCLSGCLRFLSLWLLSPSDGTPGAAHPAALGEDTLGWPTRSYHPGSLQGSDTLGCWGPFFGRGIPGIIATWEMVLLALRGGLMFLFWLLQGVRGCRDPFLSVLLARRRLCLNGWRFLPRHCTGQRMEAQTGQS